MLFLFFKDTATTEIYTLSLHDALPTCPLFDADQPLLHLRGPDARLQGRPVRHAVRPVPRQDGVDQSDRPGLCPDPGVGRQAGDVVRHPRFPRASEGEPDLLSVEQQGPARDRRRLGASGPRRTRVAVRRDENPAGPAERPRTMGVRGDADAGPRALACPGNAAGRVPRGHEQAPPDGRPDARRPGLAPRGAEPGRLRRLRLAVAPPDDRRGGPEGVPAARGLGVADPKARLNQASRTASTRSSIAISRWTPFAISRNVARPCFNSLSPRITTKRALIAFA